MIAIAGNRPALQIGRHQVHEYDTAWLLVALRRAAASAGQEDFPFLDEIAEGVVTYLEGGCSLRLLPLPALYARVRTMLECIGCLKIAECLPLLAPPLTLNLADIAREAAEGYELHFFSRLTAELSDLHAQGVEEIHFIGLRDAVMLLGRRDSWSSECDQLACEIRTFLRRQGHDLSSLRRPVALRLEGKKIG